jgi:hypothetical protein
MTPLPQEIVPVTREQAALTVRHLGGPVARLEAYFLAIRAETDAALAPALPDAAGKPYPYGRCEEISTDAFARLARRIDQPVEEMDRVLRAFVAEGGIVRRVWGVLRGQYFQNAFQIGGLYVDVSNDTVVVTKPKVEILPIQDSGLVPVRDLAHFRETAALYWKAETFANLIVPSLAPLLPMVSSSPGRLLPGLQSACDYMIALMARDGFRQAEAWLAEGPEPPEDVADAVRARVPADLRPWTDDPRQEAVESCRRARAAGCGGNSRWRDARVLDYLRCVPG